MQILVINGPNINMLGIREPDIYGTESYQPLLQSINNEARRLSVDVECFQSNHEGAIIDVIQKSLGRFDGIIINPAAYTHTSIGIADALKAVGIPAVEVHLSDIHARETFRQHSYITPVCVKTIVGKGFEGYLEAMRFLCGK